MSLFIALAAVGVLVVFTAWVIYCTEKFQRDSLALMNEAENQNWWVQQDQDNEFINEQENQ